MIANLPLLFSGGNPTSLKNMTTSELEKFITFMVACSWGHDTHKEILKPEWWPDNVTFSYPFINFRDSSPDWTNRLKNLVRKCYDYHDSTFLLVFSDQLASYPRKKLRFIDNKDRTTSLYYRPTGRLLVTFRNENMTYDQDMTSSEHNPPEIYLCDDCDGHFDSLEALNAHERICSDQSRPTLPDDIPKDRFLAAVGLIPNDDNTADTESPKAKPNSNLTRRHLSRIANERLQPFPFSSLAGRRAAKTTLAKNQPVDTETLRERIERHCLAAPSSRLSKNTNFACRYKRPIDYWTRYHTFPDQRNKKLLDTRGQILLFQCRPVRVKVERMSENKINKYLEELRVLAEKRKSEFVSASANNIIETLSSNNDPLSPQPDVIDLCSDDESVVSWNENLDPSKAMEDHIDSTADGDMKKSPIMRLQPIILFSQSLSNVQIISID